MTVKRIDDVRSIVEIADDLSAVLYANEDVFIDKASLDDVKRLGELSQSVHTLKHEGILNSDDGLEKIVLTPDFHKGSKIPVGTVLQTNGFVIPQAAGNDIGCGMCAASIDVTLDEFEKIGEKLDASLRHMFFEGGRHVEFSSRERESILKYGASSIGLLEKRGTFSNVDDKVGLRTHSKGCFDGAEFSDVFEEWISPGKRTEPTRDSFLGTIGGGNHFVEIQKINKIHDSSIAWNYGIDRMKLNVMLHSGSLSLGHAVALRYVEMAKGIWPKGVKHPENGLYILPLDMGGEDYIKDMKCAGHIALMNRLTMSLMVGQVFEKLLNRKVDVDVIHDLPHNFVWINGKEVIHRKGACPVVVDHEDEIFPFGNPVIIPGSMGTSSHIMASHGGDDNIFSCPHGAGRVASRNSGRKSHDEIDIRVVTKIDLKKVRRDIADSYAVTLSEEAPRVYKDVKPIIDTVSDAGIATRVAEFSPLLTIKG